MLTSSEEKEAASRLLREGLLEYTEWTTRTADLPAEDLHLF